MHSICTARILLHVRQAYVQQSTILVSHNVFTTFEEMDSDVFLESLYEGTDGYRRDTTDSSAMSWFGGKNFERSL